MNRLILPLFLALLLPLSTTAQDIWPTSEAWPADDSEWYFGHLHYNVLLTHITVVGTEEVDGRTFTVLGDSTYTSGQPTSYQETLVHFNGDTLFWVFEDQVYPLLCFNLEVGDTWNPLPTEHPNIWPECTASGVKIIEKSTVEFNGETYRQIRIGPEVSQPEAGEWDDPWPSVHWEGIFNERVFGYQQLFPFFNDCGGVVEYYIYDLRCYLDSELEVTLHNDDRCDHPLSVSINEIPSQQKNVLFPNPVRVGEVVMLGDIQDAKTIILYSVTGQYVEQQSLENGASTVQLFVKPGHYIVQIEQANGERVWQKLVVSP